MKLPWANRKQPKRRTPKLMEGQDAYIFRRSRTITGTTAQQVTASAQSRGQFKTDRLKLMELREHRRQILRFLCGVTFAIAALAFLIANFIVSPSITFPQKGSQHPQVTAYQQTIYRYFNDHPFERFGFLLRGQNLQTAVVGSHAEVASLYIEREWYGGGVRFSITFRQPLLVWKVGDSRFYVDAQGIAFTYNHWSEPSLSVTDQSGIPPDQSGMVASTKFIRFLGQLVHAVNGYGKGQVREVIIPAATRQVDVKLVGRDYLIKTNTDRDPLQEAEDIAHALTWFDAKGIRPEYIDVRVAHKVFYR